MLWLLCGLGAAVFASSGRSIQHYAGLAGGFFLAWIARSQVLPDASVAMLAMVAAGLWIYRPHGVQFAPFAGGIMAGVLARLLYTEGLVAPAAWAIGAILLLVSAGLAGRAARFAPGPVLEEAMLLILILALGTAAIPAIADGWQSAGALNATAEVSNRMLPAWTLLAAGGSVCMGALWSLWRHR